ncbi:hypothetical protein RB298_27040 [Priestia sp. BR_2]
MSKDMTFTESMFFSDFHPKILGHLKYAVQQGYIICAKCIEDYDFLKDFIAKRDRARLQNTAVEYAIKIRAERYDLDIVASHANNIRGSFPHYNFHVGKSIFTVSRTDKYDSLPRDADFRNMNSAINSQVELVNDGTSLIVPEFFDSVEKYYSILTFGGTSDVEFMHLGVPNPNITRWMFQYNLANALSLVEKPILQTENITKQDVMSVKDEFVKRNKDVSESE